VEVGGKRGKVSLVVKLLGTGKELEDEHPGLVEDVPAHGRGVGTR